MGYYPRTHICISRFGDLTTFNLREMNSSKFNANSFRFGYILSAICVGGVGYHKPAPSNFSRFMWSYQNATDSQLYTL